MQKSKSLTGARYAVLLLVASAWLAPCHANPLSALRDIFVKKHGADTLIVTGNYVRPRLLAELIQWKTKDPIMLVSGDGRNRVFYVSVDRERPLEIDTNSYVEFIELLNPRRLVVLGNQEVVPRRVSDILQDRFPTVMVTGTNWGVNAAAAANLFKYNHLTEHYARYFRTGVGNVVPRAGAGMPPNQPATSAPPTSLRSDEPWGGGGQPQPVEPTSPYGPRRQPTEPMQPPVIQPIN